MNMKWIGNRSQVAKAEVCKTSIRRFESDRFLQRLRYRLYDPFLDGRVAMLRSRLLKRF